MRDGTCLDASGRRIDPLHRKVFIGPVRRNTPLINAVRQGRADIVVALIADGHDVNELCGPGRRHGRGVTALYVACRMGFTEVVTALLAANAETYQADSDGDTPLILACREGHTEIVKKLLIANAEVNKARKDGDTPLIIACQVGHTEIVEKLIAANADVDHAEFDDCTPLFIASYKGHTEIVES